MNQASGSLQVTDRVLTGGQRVATITIASKMGSLGPLFWQETPRVMQELSEAGVRAAVLRGEKVFSAGIDVKANAGEIGPVLGNEEGFSAVVAQMNAAMHAVSAAPFPVIAAVHGWCIGAGLELISAADMRLCSADARFSLPEVKLGITADLGGLQRLPRIIGTGRTAHLALTAEPIDAATAERWGLVTEVLPDPDALFARADALADLLAQLPPKALEGTKRTLHSTRPPEETLEDAVRWNARHMTLDGLAAALKPAGKPAPDA